MFEPFRAALEVGLSATREELLLMIKAELERLNDEATTTRVKNECKRGDIKTPQLGRILMDLKNTPTKEEEKEETSDE